MNKKYLPLVFALVFVLIIGAFLIPNMLGMFLYSPEDGDIVFQSLPHNELVDTIEGVTKSPYSHCGMVVKEDGKWYVLEALGTVKLTPLKSWAIRGRDAQFEVYRMKGLTKDKVDSVIKAAYKYIGCKYDAKYRLDNEDIYCSELVYLGFKNALGISLGKMEKLGDLNWVSYQQSIMHYEGGPVPTERLMVTPYSLTQDPQLTLVRGKL